MLVSVHLEIVLMLRTIGAWFALNIPQARKSFWTHPIELLGAVESHFGPFGDSVSVGARLVHGLRRTYHRLGNHFGRTQFYS